jgi:hypothetical protein
MEEIMNRRSTLGIASITALGLAMLPGTAVSQQKSLKEQLSGTWIFVSSTTKNADGTPLWGPNPKGLFILTDNGRFSSHTMRSDRKSYASNNRGQGTPDENKATAVGTISSFGTYTVDEANKTYSLRYEGSSYPNLEGTVSMRPFTIMGDELRVTNPAPTVGGPPSQLVYRRAK